MVRFALLLILAVLLAAAGAVPAAGQEQRCTEIDAQGGSCDCSEQLDTQTMEAMAP